MGYTNSSLATYTKISPNRTSPRNHVIDTFTPHVYVGQVTAKRGADGFADPNREASSNYIIGHDGQMALCVEEKDRSWCSGGKDKNGNTIKVNGVSGKDNDHRAVTVEIASDSVAPYAITDAAYNALIDLAVDVCKRNGKKKMIWIEDKYQAVSYQPKGDEIKLTCHRWFANKSCPGDYVYSRLGQIADEVTKRLGGTSSQSSSSTTTPSASTGNTYTVVKGDTLSGIGSKLKIEWRTIADLNDIKSPYTIRVGQVLKLPTSGSNANNNSSGNSSISTPSVESSATTSSSVSTYTVVKGDTLSGIGSKLKIDWKSIAELNGIKPPYVINIGQVLKLPASTNESNTASSNGSTATSSTPVTKIVAGTKLNLKSVNLYTSSSAKTKASTKTGTYYVWSDDMVNNRIRITNNIANVGKSGQVTGWIDYEDATKSL